MNLNYRLILASNSPRRQLLLKELGLKFEVRVNTIDETYPKNLKPREVAKYLAKKKADVFSLNDDELVITADTTVIINNTILGKPKDEKEAMEILRKLSDNTHHVNTGVCLKTKNEQITFSEYTEVTFKKLSEEEIKNYIYKYKPLDKAGAYGIQEWIGMIGIKSIQGDYYNVVGMPLQSLWNELKKFQ